MLSAWRTDRDYHEAIEFELLQQRWRDVVDAAGDDDLVVGGVLGPAVVALVVLAVYGLVFGIAFADQGLINAARPLEQRLDDLDGEDLVREVGEVGRLISRARSDLEYSLARPPAGRWYWSSDLRYWAR